MEDRDLDPADLRAVNYAYPSYVEKLANSMIQQGWTGRHLLIEEVVWPSGHTFYHAWTGSHRIEAAKRAGLRTVPCRVMTKAEADAAFGAAGYQQYGFFSWREAISSAEGPSDKDRLRGLERANLTEAVEMLREEVEAQTQSASTSE